MSRTFHLNCKDCKKNSCVNKCVGEKCDNPCYESVWIAQAGAGSKEPWIYRDGETLDKLEAFLIKHQNHNLEFSICN